MDLRSLGVIPLLAVACGGIRVGEPCAAGPCPDAGGSGGSDVKIGGVVTGAAGGPAGGGGSAEVDGGAGGSGGAEVLFDAWTDAPPGEPVDGGNRDVTTIDPAPTRDASLDTSSPARDAAVDESAAPGAENPDAARDAEGCDASPSPFLLPPYVGRRCVGDQPQSCAEGQWSNVAPSCNPGLCDFGVCCFLSCQGPGVVKICGLDIYVPVMRCPTACVRGHCTDCIPGLRRCAGADLQYCDATGTWRMIASCPAGCDEAGTCVDSGIDSD